MEPGGTLSTCFNSLFLKTLSTSRQIQGISNKNIQDAMRCQ